MGPSVWKIDGTTTYKSDFVTFGRVTNSTSIINIMNKNGLEITARK